MAQLNKSERTLENYMQVGAELRLIELLRVYVQNSVQNLTTAETVRRINRAFSIIDDTCAELKDRMRYDFSQLVRRAALSERDFETVFYVYSDCPMDSFGTRLCKARRTIDVYMRASVEICLLKTLLSKVYTDASKLLPASKSKRIKTAINIVDGVCSKVESNMFEDFPTISTSYITEFFEATDNPAFYSMNEQINKLMKEILESLMPKE